MSYDRQCSSCGGFCGRGGCKRENVKPEQEPVAWAHQPPGMSTIYSIEPIPGPDSIPLYATPPARKPLTDEEIKNALMVDPAPIYRLMTTGCITGAELNEIMKRVARAIERAHGIGSD